MEQGIRRKPFVQEIFVTGAVAVGSGSGDSYLSSKACLTGDLMPIEAGMLIEKVFVIVDVAVTGSTAVNVGDDDSSNGFVPTAALTLGTPGMYGYDAKAAGSYLRIQTAGATDAGDIYVVPNAKYYPAAKTLKLAVTGTWTAGKLRVVVMGQKLTA
jgi:hypothetical protein